MPSSNVFWIYDGVHFVIFELRLRIKVNILPLIKKILTHLSRLGKKNSEVPVRSHPKSSCCSNGTKLRLRWEIMGLLSKLELEYEPFQVLAR